MPVNIKRKLKTEVGNLTCMSHGRSRGNGARQQAEREQAVVRKLVLAGRSGCYQQLAKAKLPVL